MVRAFTFAPDRALEPEIAGLCAELIERFPSGPFDLMEAYARIIPVVVICRLLEKKGGVPEERAPDLLSWSNAMVAMYQARRSPGIEEAAIAASRAFRAFVGGDHQGPPSPARPRPAHGSDRRRGRRARNSPPTSSLTTVILLLNAGHEATVHSIGNAIELAPEGKAVPSWTRPQSKEALRLDPPLHMFDRWVYEDLTLFGNAFAAAATVWAACSRAANRDPQAFPDLGRGLPPPAAPRRRSPVFGRT